MSIESNESKIYFVRLSVGLVVTVSMFGFLVNPFIPCLRREPHNDFRASLVDVETNQRGSNVKRKNEKKNLLFEAYMTQIKIWMMQTWRQKKKCKKIWWKAHQHAITDRRRFLRRQLNDQSRSISCGLRIPRLDDDCRSSSSCSFYLLFLRNLQESMFLNCIFWCSTTSCFRDEAHFSSDYRARNYIKQWTDDNCQLDEKLKKTSRSSQIDR